MGWLWYLVTLLPVIGLVQIGDQALADRYTYLPLIGIFATLCWLLPDALPRLERAWAPAAVLLVLALSAATVKQVQAWRDEVTLFGHAVSVTRDNYLANENLGTAQVTRGRTAEAAEHFREAVRIRPTRAVSQSNLGNALSDLGRRDEAIAAHREAVRLAPGDAVSRMNLGSALAAAGRMEEASVELAEAVRLDPSNAAARENLARALLAESARRAGAGEHARAVELLKQAEAAQPGSPSILAALAFLYATSDDPAVRDPTAALDLATRARASTGTRSATVLDAMAASLAASGRYAEAVREIDLALAAAGDSGRLRTALAGRRAQYLLSRPVVLRHVQGGSVETRRTDP
jgi:Flp pilus assembly protein TadD